VVIISTETIMANLNDRMSALPGAAKLAIGAALLAAGAVVGGGVAHLERPSIEMAPANLTPIAKLSSADGIVTVKGKVVESFGDSFVLADASGRTLIRAGRDGETFTVGSSVTVQGRADDGKLRPSFLVDGTGKVTALRGPHGHGGHHGPGGEDGPRPSPESDGSPQPTPPTAPGAQSAKPVPSA
jgi:hypothetical protein